MLSFINMTLSLKSFKLSYKPYFEKYCQDLLIYGTGSLLLCNLILFLMYFMDICRENMSLEPREPCTAVMIVIEAIIGRNLTVFDFFYLSMYQISALLTNKFRLRYIFFLVYLQICKIVLSGNTSERLSSANIGLQTILSLQLLLVILNLKFKPSTLNDISEDFNDCTCTDIAII